MLSHVYFSWPYPYSSRLVTGYICLFGVHYFFLAIRSNFLVENQQIISDDQLIHFLPRMGIEKVGVSDDGTQIIVTIGKPACVLACHGFLVTNTGQYIHSPVDCPFYRT